MENTHAIEVLLVEDNPRDEEFTIRAFRKNKLAKRIFIVRDGAEALDFLFCRGEYITRNISNQPKVVLLDLKLPKVSGMDVLREVKSDVRTAGIPVVIITSSNEQSDISEAYKLNANSYVVKPVGFEQFANAISSLGLYWLLVNEPLS